MEVLQKKQSTFVAIFLMALLALRSLLTERRAASAAWGSYHAPGEPAPVGGLL